MKKAFPVGAFLLIAALPASAQRPASTTPQNRKALLEVFTGTHANTAATAYRIADSLKAANAAGSLFLVNIHAGATAVPSVGEPDLRSIDASHITGIAGMSIPYYPSGAVNRHRFGSNSGFAVSPTQWGGYIDSIQAKSSSHSIALDAVLDVSTRKLSIYTDVYAFNGFPNVINRHLTVMLLEDSVSGPQLGGAAQYPSQIDAADSSYKHNHVLRKVLSFPYYASGAYTYAAGSSTLQSLFYSVPAQYINNPAILGNLRLLAFLSEGDTNVITAATGPILLTGFPGRTDLQIMPQVKVEKEVCVGTLKPVVRLYNNGSSAISGAVLQTQVNGQPPVYASFNRSLGVAKSALFALPPATFVPDSANTLKVKIAIVDGMADPIPAGDTLLVSKILKTTRIANGNYVVMNFTQDRFGAENRWQITDEATGAVKLAGGPYPDLNSNSSLLHTDSFKATPETCYEVLVFDAQANGINRGSGAGEFEVTSNGQILHASNGNFGARSRAVFKTAAQLTTIPGGIATPAAFANSVRLSPNPAAGETTLEFTLSRGTRANIQVIDMTGRVMAQVAEQNLSAGTHALPISTAGLAGGVYNIRLATAEDVITRRLIVK